MKIFFKPSSLSGEILPGESVLDAAVRLGAGIASDCGGQGTCGKCAVVPVEGDMGPVTDAEREMLSPEQAAAGYRLACQCSPQGDCSIYVPEESSRAGSAIKPGVKGAHAPDPDVTAYPVVMAEAALSHTGADAGRLAEALEAAHGIRPARFTLHALRALPGALRERDWRAVAVVRRIKGQDLDSRIRGNDRMSGHGIIHDRITGHEVIDVLTGESAGVYGLALDIGTTTLAGYLINLATGEVVASRSASNPQAAFGEDVLSRVSFATARPDGASRLRALAVGAANALARDLAADAGVSAAQIYEASVVGNTVMLHLFFGLPAAGLGAFPFVPAVSRVSATAKEAGLRIHPDAEVFTLPIVGGFVGADLVAALVADGTLSRPETTLLMDLGTNGELALVHKGRLLTASCATGPAFEGARISCGMRAAPGAIEKVIIDPDTFEVMYGVVGAEGLLRPMQKSGARGICGSGIVDAVAGMRRAGIIDARGTFARDADTPRVRAGRAGLEYVIAWGAETAHGRDIAVTQEDVRAVQLAKAALAAGASVLMAEAGVAEPDKVALAGAFGSYIGVESAIALGLLPVSDPAKVRVIGNAAGEGAAAALASVGKRREAEEVARAAEHVELSVHPGFQERFIEGLGIGG